MKKIIFAFLILVGLFFTLSSFNLDTLNEPAELIPSVEDNKTISVEGLKTILKNDLSVEVDFNSFDQYKDIFNAISSGQSESTTALFNSSNPKEMLAFIIDKYSGGDHVASYVWAELSNLCNSTLTLTEDEHIAANTISDENRKLLMSQGFEVSDQSVYLEHVINIRRKCVNFDVEYLSQFEIEQAFIQSGENGYAAGAVVGAFYDLAVINGGSGLPDSVSDVAVDLYNIQFAEKITSALDSFDRSAVYALAEFSPHVFNSYSRFSDRGAWLLAACKMGFDNGCQDKSGLIKLRFCINMDLCEGGGSVNQGLKLRQGELKFNEIERTANEIVTIVESKGWDKLGF